ncbi:pilus assembly protein [Francisella hispaniensis]|uniref:pilus assembly protein n=1 Tax=Francisella hispaniensis TaxID=622488 RepID=UPI001907E3E8|nr:pilus assembly protein [Francisella hispaniensis]MBK2357210.1 pilus assembly protein [Francisella hispaniensis]
MLLKKVKSQAGFGIVESMLAALILLFVLSSGFLLLNSVLVNITLENKKDEIANILDERVSVYRLTGVFDDTKTKDGIEFIKTVVLEKENDAKPEENSEAVNRFKSLSVADIKKIAEKADKKAQKAAANDVNVVYKVVNIAAVDNQLGIADRVKIIEREVKQDDNQA